MSACGPETGEGRTVAEARIAVAAVACVATAGRGLAVEAEEFESWESPRRLERKLGSGDCSCSSSDECVAVLARGGASSFMFAPATAYFHAKDNYAGVTHGRRCVAISAGKGSRRVIRCLSIIQVAN